MLFYFYLLSLIKKLVSASPQVVGIFKIIKKKKFYFRQIVFKIFYFLSFLKKKKKERRILPVYIQFLLFEILFLFSFLKFFSSKYYSTYYN